MAYFFIMPINSAFSREGIAYFSAVIKCKEACSCNVVGLILCTAMNTCIYDSHFTLVYLGNGEMFMCSFPGFLIFSSSAKNKEHLSNFKHLFAQCQPGGKRQSGCLQPHPVKEIGMLIHADLLSEVRCQVPK